MNKFKDYLEMTRKKDYYSPSLVERALGWGGETVNPINLGHIYMSCIPQDISDIYLSDLEEVELLQFLRPIIGTGRIFKHGNYLIVF